jgi:hypothetical protein
MNEPKGKKPTIHCYLAPAIEANDFWNKESCIIYLLLLLFFVKKLLRNILTWIGPVYRVFFTNSS